MKNVLLACMSIVKVDEEYNEYIYEINGKDETLSGYMTNEAPTKAVIKKLSMQGEYLDKVVMLCTNMVLEGTVQHKSKDLIKKMNLERYTEEEVEQLELHKETNKELYKLEKYKHIDFYQEKVNQYAKSLDSYYEKNPIEYVTVTMPNVAKDYELTESSLEAANQVTLSKDKVRLYIDFNGGPRTVPFMLLAVSNLMKLRDVEIQEITTMKYEKPKTRIQNMKPVFESFDLVTGINEYIRYGYINGLKQYFKDSESGKIKSILRSMEEFANSLQLCRTEDIMKKRGDLWDSFEKYKEEYSEKADLPTYEQLFLYVISDIMGGCKEILNGELPDIIKWCVERGFVQQALTFCSEEMPRYFWDKGIYRANEIEEKAYNYFLAHMTMIDANTGEEKKHPDSSRYISGNDDKSSRYAYNWMILYVPVIWKCKNFLKGFYDEGYKNTINVYVKKEHIEKYEKKLTEIKKFKLKESEMQKNSLADAGYKAGQLLYWNFKNKRGNSKISFSNLNEILIVYFLLKEQRNISNHASNDNKAWSYSYLCDIMTQMADVLKKVTVK